MTIVRKLIRDSFLTTIAKTPQDRPEMLLLPRISLRQLMLFMVVVAVYLAVLSMAWRGNVVAFGLATSLAGLIPVFLAYAFSYWIHYAFARFSTRVLAGKSTDDQTPFRNRENVS